VTSFQFTKSLSNNKKASNLFISVRKYLYTDYTIQVEKQITKKYIILWDL